MLAVLISGLLGLLTFYSNSLSAEIWKGPALMESMDFSGPIGATGLIDSSGPAMPRGTSGPTGPTGPASGYAVGEYAQGGVIFWVDPSGQHGLVAAITDQDDGNGIAWYNGSYSLTATYANGLYMGAINTATIQSLQGEGIYAASIAANYSVTVEGVPYDGWYLPSNIELALMYEEAHVINTTAVANGGTDFLPALYWSSNENVNTGSYALNQDFASGEQNGSDKDILAHVRAIRAF